MMYLKSRIAFLNAINFVAHHFLSFPFAFSKHSQFNKCKFKKFFPPAMTISSLIHFTFLKNSKGGIFISIVKPKIQKSLIHFLNQFQLILIQYLLVYLKVIVVKIYTKRSEEIKERNNVWQ